MRAASDCGIDALRLLVVAPLAVSEAQRPRLLVEVAPLEIERPCRRGHLASVVGEGILDDLPLRLLDQDAEWNARSVEPLRLRGCAAWEDRADVGRAVMWRPCTL